MIYSRPPRVIEASEKISPASKRISDISQLKLREPSKTLNRSDVHGWRRFLYGLIYAVSVMGWFFCVALIGVGVKIILAGFSNLKDEPLRMDYWQLIGPGCCLAGIACIVVNIFIRAKFKREGAEDLEDVVWK